MNNISIILKQSNIMNGKDKCSILKTLREKMAKANNIPFKSHECSFDGECSGTCPVCESEAIALMEELRKQEAQGAKIQLEIMTESRETEESSISDDLYLYENEEELMGDVPIGFEHPINEPKTLLTRFKELLDALIEND